MKLRNTTLSIPVGNIWLSARLAHAPDVIGLVMILKPGPIDDVSAREHYIAQSVHAAGHGSLIVDLLTHHEETRDVDARYNIPQLAQRLIAVREWIAHQPPLEGLSIGLISSDTTTAAAIRAAARHPDYFAAIAARAGRVDLAGAAPLRALATPLCMVVGDKDVGRHAIEQAFALVSGTRVWLDLPGASGLFHEPGALERFCRHAIEWFAVHVPPPRAPASDATPLALPDGGGGDQDHPGSKHGTSPPQSL